MLEADVVAVRSLSTSGGISELDDAGERARVPGEALEEAGEGPWLDADEVLCPLADAPAEE